MSQGAMFYHRTNFPGDHLPLGRLCYKTDRCETNKQTLKMPILACCLGYRFHAGEHVSLAKLLAATDGRAPMPRQLSGIGSPQSTSCNYLSDVLRHVGTSNLARSPTAMIASAIPAAIRRYSIAVAPDSEIAQTNVHRKLLIS
jgi:hypothetical protein